MKFILLVLAVVVLLWLLRSSFTRRPPGPPPAPRSAPPDELQPMVTCAHCGIHLPVGESLPGRGGVFCGEAHRTAFEKANPAP